MPLPLLLLAIAAAIVLALLLAVFSLGAFARQARGTPSSALPVADPAASNATPVDTLIGPMLAEHAGETGMVLLDGDLEAFAVRARSARAAGRSLDLQYYIWANDLTGRLLISEVLDAADRGARVRLLLDDVNAQGQDRALRALDDHPNIAVRLFNPARNRRRGLRRGLEIVLRIVRTTRRMHNKVWIADGRIAVIGGRNIGDKYFDAAATSTFRDLDVAAIGVAVEQASAIFDRFWNSDAVVPMAVLHRRRGNLRAARRGLARLSKHGRSQPYLDRVAADPSVQALLSGHAPIHWTEIATVVSDPPDKGFGQASESWMIQAIGPHLVSASSSLEIISPYFIPGVAGSAALLDLAGRGVKVSILTNSLAATDVAAVHGAYARYRKRLVAGGVQLFELRPYKRRRRVGIFGTSSASLHTKAFTVDDGLGFIGSMNFDPRSIRLNTEMGLLFQSLGLVCQIRAVFATETAPDRSYRLALQDGRLLWHGGGAAAAVVNREPMAGWLRRAIAAIAALLPIESQL